VKKDAMDALRGSAVQIGGIAGDAIRAGLSVVMTVDVDPDGTRIELDFPRGDFPDGRLPAAHWDVLVGLANGGIEDEVTAGHVKDLLSEIATDDAWRNLPARMMELRNRRNLPARMMELRDRLSARPRAKYVKADPPPIYDDVYYDGVRMLDEDAAGDADVVSAGVISLDQDALTESAERAARCDDEFYARQIAGQGTPAGSRAEGRRGSIAGQGTPAGSGAEGRGGLIDEQSSSEMRDDVDDLIALAARYDDKPHQLYWRISRMADRWCRDPDQKAKAREMMAQAYETANARTEPTRDLRELSDLRAQLAAVNSIFAERDLAMTSRIEAIQGLIDELDVLVDNAGDRPDQEE
jgi:hypothetical protein